MSDLISRQAAQKLICEDGTRLERDGVYEMTMCAVKQWAVDLLDELPSVEPEKCGDCISRKALLKKLQKVATESWKMKLECNAEIVWNQCIDFVKDAPSVEPERKAGHWIMIDEELQRYRCSECGEIIKLYSINNETLKDYKFSHCGAKMIEQQESEGME